MRILRSSMFGDMREPPITTVVRDSDVIDTLEGVRHHVMTPGVFIAFEIFEVPDGTSVEEATMIAVQRQQENARVEQDQAVLYFWTVHVWPPIHDRGVILNPRPAPLSSTNIRAVFEQLCKHPDYGHRTVMTRSNEHELIVLQDGTITTHPEPEEE